MANSARDRLCELLAEYGPSVCTTPATLRLLMQQSEVDSATDVDDLARSLDVKAVRTLLARPVEVAELQVVVADLVRAGYSDERARWVAETWIAALTVARIGDSAPGTDWQQWNALRIAPDVGGGTGLRQRSIAFLAIVAVVGGLGGACPALGLALHGEAQLSNAWQRAFAGLSFETALAALSILGGLGGLAGGVLGWTLGGDRRSPYDARVTLLNVRVVFAAFGAFQGAALGVVASGDWMGLYGTLPLALVGAMIGMSIGLFIATQISRLH